MDVDAFASVLRRERRVAGMPLVNCCVVLGKYNKVLYPWKITAAHVSTSLRGCYHRTLESRVHCTVSGSSVAAKTFRLSKEYLSNVLS